MSKEWEYQVRIFLSEEFAEVARTNPDDESLKSLADILEKYEAVLKSQYDAFAGYVREAEENDVNDYPLYEWTKGTLEDDAKVAKFKKQFTVYAEGGLEVYSKEAADGLEKELKALMEERPGIVTRVMKHSSDPARNPQPPR